jgi:hypothetical protein
MLLSIPSVLDSLAPTTEQFETTQVEVSLDDDACSIQVISSESRVESVVFVPSEQWSLLGLLALNRNAPPKRGQAVSSTKGKGTKSNAAVRCSSITQSARKTEASKGPPGSSRLRSGRRLSEEVKPPLSRGRETQSCPPATSRFRDDDPSTTASRSGAKSKARTASAGKRDVSCPPAFLGGRGDSSKPRGSGDVATVSTANRKRKVRRHPADSPNRRANKPDLVSQTSKRIIGSYRVGGGGGEGFCRATTRNKRNRIIPEVSV